MINWKFFLKFILFLIFVSVFGFFVLSRKETPQEITYGVSFSKFHSDELNLPWKEVYISLLDDLGVRNFRLSAHWPMVEFERDIFNFSELDFQLNEARKRKAKVIFAIGRRLPGWPECHEPAWVKQLSQEEKQLEIISYIEAVINRYKDYENIIYWQVENEPFLSVFAKEHCGKLDKKFLRKEIALVKDLDPSRKVLVTDSGNLGLWYNAWRYGDAFGTSVYIYLWNPSVGQVRTIYLPSFYKVKSNLMRILFGQKENMLIELSLEPWLLQPIVNTPIEEQIKRMNEDKFLEIVSFAKDTGFSSQYLWGAEWWYWMKKNGYGNYWNIADEIFNQKKDFE